MKLVLSRHGNTFSSGEKAVWIGCRSDEYAEIVAAQLDYSVTPIVDAALTEIDYGDWEGLSTEEIR